MSTIDQRAGLDQGDQIGQPSSIELSIGGMTCASCAARIEKKLNKLDGVSASVNYATEKAKVTYGRSVAPADLVGTVEATGYTATLPVDPAVNGDAQSRPAEADEAAQLRLRLLVSLVLAVPVVVMSMVPMLQFTNWQWLALTLASPVVVWGALPFHRAAWANARHGAATMDTLISVGVSAAYLWSLWALFVGDAGMPGMRMSFSLLPEAGVGANHIYLEVASAVTVFILSGRYFEARAKKRSGCRVAGFVGYGCQGRRRAPRGHRGPDPHRATHGERRLHRPARRKGCYRRRRRRGQLRSGRLDAHRRVRAGGGPPR